MGLDIDIIYTDGEDLTDDMTNTEEGYCHYHINNRIQCYGKFWDLNMFFVSKFRDRDINSEYIELNYDILIELKEYFEGHVKYGEISDLVNRCLIKINKGKRVFYYTSW